MKQTFIIAACIAVAMAAMLSSVGTVWAIVGVEALALYALRGSVVGHRMFVILNMLLIVLLGGRWVQYGPLISNVGCIFYSSVLAGMWLIVRNFGKRSAHEMAAIVLCAVLMTWTIQLASSPLPVIPGNEVIAAAYAAIAGVSGRIMAASFLAFVAGQALYIWLIDKALHRSVWLSYVLPMVVTQAVDTVLFFPAAFGWGPGILSLAMDGFMVKVVIGLLFVPLLAAHDASPDEMRQA